jgi:ubiquinone biosynthesis protein
LAPFSRRLRPSDVVRHFEGVVLGELDLRLEGAAAAEFAANIEQDKGFTVPKPVWDYSARQVMTLGWVEGINLSDRDALVAAGHDPAALGERVLQLFLSHALRDGFFHADMHHGNLKVNAAGEIVAYDFGIMGRLDEYTRRVYAEILFGFIRRDYRRVAEVHFEAGYVPADRDIDEFASALRVVGEPIFGMDASQISMARLLAYLFEVTERFGMETRTELILLQRTMVVVEGVARSLDPHINIWTVARPVVEGYITKNIGPRALLRDLRRTAPVVLSRFGPKLPGAGWSRPR